MSPFMAIRMKKGEPLIKWLIVTDQPPTKQIRNWARAIQHVWKWPGVSGSTKHYE